MVTASAAQRADTSAHRPPESSGPFLTGNKVTLPLVLVKGYPFVDGAINGKTGKLMFDIGDASTLSVDTHTVPVSGAIATGHGFFGSGQTFDVVSIPVIHDMSLGNGLAFGPVKNIRGNPGIPIEDHITHEFIGWLGVRFFAGYVAKLDYAAPSVTFFQDDASGAGEKAALANEHVVQTIALSINDRYGLVRFPVQLGHQAATATVDTGSMNSLWLAQNALDQLKKAGALKPAGSDEDSDTDNYRLTGLTINGRVIPDMPVHIVIGAPPMMKILGAPDGPVLALGYEFLKTYKDVLDYDGKTLTLLAP